jgi:16S rRNA (guanine527-N7)-methyltransferase
LAVNELSADQRAKVGAYLDLLLAANERMNLTRIRDRADAETFHVRDALQLLPYLPGFRSDVADVGSGGGVPGIVLAIVRPKLDFTLVESVGKKADFLAHVTETLGLANVEVVNGRAERLANRQFEVVTTRAVASLEKLLTWCRPLVRRGGTLLAMKGPKLSQELDEAAEVIKRQRATITTRPYELGGQSGRVIAKVTWPS